MHHLSATEAVRAFRARELSPVELMTAVIARAEQTEPVVNALCHRFFDQALDQAREAERRYAGHGPAPRPLEGVPTVIKEDEPVAGQPWTQGSLAYRDAVAGHSSAFARRILDSGAIVHARSTASEFASAAFTHSKLWGVTRNPWQPEYSPGGSSGGSGAALAAGSTTLASGSDTAGSIRIPASFNGIVGFKPPRGRVPVDPPFNLDSYVHNGPMGRTVADVALFQNVLAGPDPADVVSLRPKYTLPDRLGDVRGLRVALSTELGGWPVDPEVRRNTLAFGEALRDAGAEVREVDLLLPRDTVLRAAALHFHHGFGTALDAELAHHGDTLSPYVADFVRWARETAGGGTVLDGLVLEAELYAPVGALLADHDALVCPTAATRGLVAGDDYVGHGIEVGGHPLDFYLESLFALVFNILSACPVLAVPSGFADNGVPTGVQIVGRTYDDATVFHLGAAAQSGETTWPSTIRNA